MSFPVSQPAMLRACSTSMLRSSARSQLARLPQVTHNCMLQPTSFFSRSLHSREELMGSSIQPIVRTYPGEKCGLRTMAGGRGFLSSILKPGKKRIKGSSTDRPKLQKGTVSPPRLVPDHIRKPPYADTGVSPAFAEEPEIQDAEGIKKMRAAGKLAKRVLDMAGQLAKEGVTTDEIDRAVHQMTIDNGAYPSPLNYGKFPKSVCTSVNECICHGIPDSTKLVDGDIINIDITVFLDGHHGDTSRTFLVGNVHEDHKTLVDITEQSLMKAISICGPGVPFKNIGRTIHDFADEHDLGVVRDFVGHGIGKVFHAGPAVMHFRNNVDQGVMQVGQTFTIEPMLSLGSTRPKLWRDKWTAVTSDSSWTAQFEHTLLITEDGVEILTA